MKFWLKSLGSAAKQVRDDWGLEAGGILRRHATFARKPMVEEGDGIIYYAAGTGLVFAGGVVTSHPYANATNSRDWPWRVDVVLEAAHAFVHSGVKLDRLNVPASRNDVRLRIKRRSHVQLAAEEYQAAMAALRA